MRIRTLDEEPENDNTLEESREMGTRAKENDYEIRNIIDKTTTAITFGVTTDIDETLPNTAVTFGVATTNVDEGTRAEGEIEVLSEAAATNTSKTEVICFVQGDTIVT